MHKSKFSLKGLAAASVVAGAAFVFSGAALAVQTVVPSSSASGTPNLNSTTVQVPSNGSYTFYGVYSDNQSGAESGLGLKLRYDNTKINIAVSEEYTKCRIAPAQNQLNGASSQWVFGWIDTSIRRTSGTPNGQVGWPDVANPAGADDCLAITPANSDTGAGSASAQKLFKGVVTWVGTPSVGTNALITLDDDGNYSFASGTPGFTDTSFTVQAAAAAACNLDVDGSGTRQALVDGVLLVRNMLGVSGAAYTSGVSFPGTATRTTESAIKTFILAHNYDTDGSGSQQALVDGVILVRLMLGVADASLLNGVTLPGSATFTTAAAIRANVNTRCGTTF
jgi:hypothetical protein